MKTLKFEVPGLPIGKGAARHNNRGFTYTPTRTRQYMDYVRKRAQEAGATCHDCPCAMVIFAHFPIPTSYPKKLQERIRAKSVAYTKKPDTDNLSKIKDALIGVAFKDDALVFRETVSKFYTDRPRLEVIIFYYEPSDVNMLGFRA